MPGSFLDSQNSHVLHGLVLLGPFLLKSRARWKRFCPAEVRILLILRKPFKIILILLLYHLFICLIMIKIRSLCYVWSSEWWKTQFYLFDSKTRRKRAIFCYKTLMPPALGLKTGVFKTPWGYYEWKNRSHLLIIFADKPPQYCWL